METNRLLSQIQALIGNLRPVNQAETKEIKALGRALGQALVDHPDLSVTGSSVAAVAPSQSAQMEATGETEASAAASSSHIVELLKSELLRLIPSPQAGAVPPAKPLIFRRETPLRSNLLGSSVAEWAVGMTPSQTFGPLRDEHGLPVWFDFFFPVRSVRVRFADSPNVALAIPVWGMLNGRESYNIEPGSVWIASGLLAADPSLQGYFTGLKVQAGALELSQNATINGGEIWLAPGSTAKLSLNLDQNKVPTPSAEAGFDATDAALTLPPTFSLNFNLANGSLTAGAATCEVYGCASKFTFAAKPPVWVPAFAQILVPYSVRTDSAAGDVFTIRSSRSQLCNFDGEAKLDDGSGWLLPAAKIDPASFGQAAGTGALVIALTKGVAAEWKGLRGGKTRLVHPAIVVEPGIASVVDFFAANTYGRQKWTLWRNANAKHHSEMVLGFGNVFPLIYVTNSAGNETVSYFCSHRDSLDRPVDANGQPFKVESTVAWASIIQSGTAFSALLLDTDLLSGNPAEAFRRSSIVLRNAFFTVSPPYSLFLYGQLPEGQAVDAAADLVLSNGVLILDYAIAAYIPMLPDPYVTNYMPALRGQLSLSRNSSGGLAGVVRWPDPAQAKLGAEPGDNPAYVYFRLLPVNQQLLAPAQNDAALANLAGKDVPTPRVAALAATRNFRTGIRSLNQNLLSEVASSALPIARASTPLTPLRSATGVNPASTSTLRTRMENAITSQALQPVVREMETNPLLAHIDDKAALINKVLNSAVARQESSPNLESPLEATAAFASHDTALGTESFLLLDISSNADQMGVSLGSAIRVERGQNGETSLRTVFANLDVTGASGGASGLQIDNMDVVASATNLRAVTLPQISWEPFLNIPLAVESVDPDDLITVVPGLVLCDNDGPATRIASVSPFPVPIAPLPVTRHFIKEFNDEDDPQALLSSFTLPFAIVARAQFLPKPHSAPGSTTEVSVHQPFFDQLRGGLQIKAQTLTPGDPGQSTSFPGWTVQLDNLKWFLGGAPISGGTLGKTVGGIFNRQFHEDQPSVPVEAIEFSGYGASIFSNWRNDKAKIAEVSQANFDVMLGRTAHEVVQVRSILYPFGVHVVRTITLMRSPNGYVYRSDSGWKAESDGFFDFSYVINFNDPTTGSAAFPDIPVPSYVFHNGTVRGVSNVREIKDFADAGPFKSSFTPNGSGLPLDLARWQFLFENLTSLTDPLQVDLEPVVFDADVHLDNVTSGGAPTGAGDFVVQSRKMLGYVQVAPAHVLIPPSLFAALLNFQNGSLGGPVNCVIDVAKSGQTMRLSRVDVNPASDAAGNHVFVTAERGSFVLPQDGAWSVVQQRTDTGDVQPMEPGRSIPLIQTNGDPTLRASNPADVLQSVSNIAYGILQSTGTQKLLFSVPQFVPGTKQLRSAETYFADAYKLLNAKGVFPNIANALGLAAPQKQLDILGEGLLKLATADIKLADLLPANYQYTFINEPGILKVYAEYATDSPGTLGLGIDSSTPAPADRWKAALSNIRIVVDLGPLTRLMWVDGNFDAASSVDPKYNNPNLQFSDLLQTAKDILQVLATLTGDDFDSGMNIGMSNSPDNWEYKFDCSMEIPVIKFPSPEELAIDPNPPLKLEAGLRVGFYFNEVLSVPTDLKQLAPACGAYVDFTGRIEVQCFTLAIASVYGVGQANLGISADTKAGKMLSLRFGFGAEIVVGLPVVLNVGVLYVVGVQIDLGETSLAVGASLLFRGSADICDGLVSICIQIEAAGSVKRDEVANKTSCIAQVTFAIDVTVAWVIDISFSDSWQETRQIA
jgi:hypothetical protein